MKYVFILLGLLAMPTWVCAQISPTDSLLADINKTTEPPVLLPEKMLFTQRALWGNNGLMRTWIPLTVENRRKEFKLRRTMFNIHQTTGILTLAGMVAQGLVGARLYNHYSDDLKHTHLQLARAIRIGYGITALMPLTSPPAIVHRRGFSSAKLHRNLAILHFTGMVLTNVLAGQNPETSRFKTLPPGGCLYHSWSLYAGYRFL